jgi:antitoxin component YwqK of YwqJK toxin-antitoxin module
MTRSDLLCPTLFLFCVMILIAGCKTDTEGLQETLKKTLQGKPVKPPLPGEKRITPSKEDKRALENSISSCPEESKLAGKAFPQGKHQWCAYRDDANEIVKHGEFRQWHPSGALQIKAFYEDNELHGKFLEFYPNGQIKEETSYQHGRKHGKSVQWNKEGKKLREATYHDDLLNGPYVEYLKDEKPRIKGTYHGDIKSGIWEEYDNKGTITRKAEYRNDMKHGRVSEFNNQGKIKAQGFYEKDQQMGHWIYFDNEGIKQSEGNLVAGKKHGRWLEYDKQGAVRRTTYFNEGRKTDTITHRSTQQNPSGGGGSFGSRDILGTEPPVRRRRPVMNPPAKRDRPEPLKQDGWAPL